MTDAAVLKRLAPTRYLEAFVLGAGVRENGRAFEASREATVISGSIVNSLGSALVRMGGTAVVCAIRGEIAEPDLREPTRGFTGQSSSVGRPDAQSPISTSRRSALRAVVPARPATMPRSCPTVYARF